jgi:tetratricopeptide (TPR) repeat protein
MSLLEKGKKLYELGKYEEAIKHFDQAKDVNICEILEEKCISLLYIGKYKEAKSCADEAIQKKCNEYENALALAIKAEALSYIGDSSNAIKLADKARDKARILSQKHKKDIDCYALFVKGYALDYSNEHDDALERFNDAIKEYCQDEEAVEALIGKGIALNYKGMKQKDKDCYEEAEKCFDRAIEICNENKSARYQDIAYAYLNKSVSLYNLEKDKEEVLECVRDAKSNSKDSISSNPNDAHSWMIRGVSYFKLGSYDAAILCYDKIITDINPEFDHAWCLQGYALNFLERYEEALIYFDEAIEMNSKDPDYHMGKGISLYGLERYDEAIECFDKALFESAYTDMVFFLKGASNYGNQWYIEALDYFKKVDDINLENQKHIYVGACYYHIGLVEEARNEYDAARKSNSKLPEVYYNLGVLNNNDGKTDIARKNFENCLEVDKKFAKAREALGKLDSPSSTSEWFKYWFGNGKAKKAFGLTLILSIFALIIFTISTNTYTLYHNQNIASNTNNQSFALQVLSIDQSILSSVITGITIMIGLLIVILLLPSIRRFKVAYIELEPVTIDTKVPQHMEILISKVRFGMQSF